MEEDEGEEEEEEEEEEEVEETEVEDGEEEEEEEVEDVFLPADKRPSLETSEFKIFFSFFCARFIDLLLF